MRRLITIIIAIFAVGSCFGQFYLTFPDDESDAEAKSDSTKEKEEFVWDSKLVYSIYGGFSYWYENRANDCAVDFKDHVDDLRTGGHFGFEVKYKYTDNWQFGLKTQLYLAYANGLYKTSSSYYYSYYTGSGALSSTDATEQTLMENVCVFFIGPSANYVFYNTQNFDISFGAAVGYFRMWNSYEMGEHIDEVMKSHSLGVVPALTFDYRIAKHCSLYLQLSSQFSCFKKYKIDSEFDGFYEVEKNHYMNINRGEISLGISFF